MTRRNISKEESVDEYLEDESPSLSAILRCDDVQAQWRNKNKKLLIIFSKKENVHKMIDILQTSKDFQTDRHILGLFISPNILILQQMIYDIGLTEHLVETLDKIHSIHRYVIGIVMQILLKAFDTWPIELMENFISSNKIYPIITNALQYPAVFHFASRFVPRLDHDITFIWIVFASLMDEHGTGPAIPHDVNQTVAQNAVLPRLTPIQRQKALEVLCIYFNEFGNRSELFYLVSKALPLMLQDASDDQERAIVLRLGLNIEPNEALGYCVLSVVNCFKSSDILLQYSLLYIAAWNVMIGNKSIEFFVYRLLKRPANNFVLIACAAMIRKVLEVDKSNTELTSTLIQIIDNAYQTNPLMKSNMMQAFRTELSIAAGGTELDPESMQCAQQLKFPRKIVQEIDYNLIEEFHATDQKIMQNNDIFVPEFNVRNLWKNQRVITEMNELWKTTTRLSFLPTVSPICRPLPSPAPLSQSPQKSKIFTFNSPDRNNPDLVRMKKRLVHSDDENDIDNEKEDESSEFHTLDAPKRKPLIIQDGIMRPPSTIVIENDDELDEEESLIEFELPEVEVNESLSALQSKEINDEKINDEPIPTEELAKGQKPIPKINPESPRTGKPLFLRTSLFSDEKRPEKPPPILIPETTPKIDQILLIDEEEEYVYEYEYVDEDESPQKVRTPKKMTPEKKKFSTPELVPIELEENSPQKKKPAKELLLQLDLENVDEVPVAKPKPVMHRRVLIIEVPEKKPAKLFMTPTLVVERPEIEPVHKLVISQTPRVFCNFDDTQIVEEEKIQLDNEEFIEDIISF